jgi:hypothetical protein
MNFYPFKTLFFVFLISSCSFKKPDAEGKYQNSLTATANQDSDGDGKSDSIEINEGLDPFVADVPIFSGSFFQEMKVTTNFYEPIRNSEESVSFQVRQDLASENGIPYEERDFLDSGSEFISEQNALLAKRSSYRAFHQTQDLGPDQLGYFSPPRMNDLKIFPYSNRVALLSQTHDFEEIEFSIMNRLNFSFKGAKKTYTDIVINLYWYDEQTREFKVIGSDFLKGVYEFNHDYLVPLNFKTNNKNLVKMISINGGRFLYLKVMDFKVIELNRFYKQILSGVQEKSVPVLISNKNKPILKYIGINGRPTQLKRIIDLATSNTSQIYNNEIVRIEDETNSTTIENDPYGDKGKVENKWFLLTSEITNSPFSYSFSPRDVINLTYLSSASPNGLIPSYFGNIATTESYQTLKTIKILKNNFIDLRLNLRPSFAVVPMNKASRLLACNATPLSKSCFEYSHEVKSLKGIQALQASAILYLTINNVEFRLDQLIEQKLASFRVKNSEVIEIKLNEPLLLKIPESNGITITFSTRPTNLFGCTGIKICESNGSSCDKFLPTPPSCTEDTQGINYVLKDLTQKTPYPVSAEMFFSVEYI